MSLFDYYQPVPELHCPACGQALEAEWQGMGGGCAMLVWRQGNAAPIEQRVSDDIRWAESELSRFRLPPSFVIRTHCCSPRFAVEAKCKTSDGTWSETRVVNAANARQGKEERAADFNDRLRWLAGNNRVPAA